MKPLTKFIPRIKKEYVGKLLNLKNTHEHPMFQFDAWFKEVHEVESSVEVNAFSLATASQAGVSNSRMVLLKAYDEHGLVFFTNYNSAKANEIEENANVSALFYWPDTNREVRFKGIARKTDPEYNQKYFESRPVKSQLAAYYSEQSREMSEEEQKQYIDKVENATDEGFTADIEGKWGGYLIAPSSIEFWQGHNSRMHDRVLYTLQGKDQWEKKLLYP